jgi:hypothetical protein
MRLPRQAALAALSVPCGFALAWARYRNFGTASLGNLPLGIALALQFIGYQRMLAQTASGLAEGLLWTHWGWFLLALALPGAGPALGGSGFLALLLLVRLPLAGFLGEQGLQGRWLLLFAMLALVGCLPFPFFSAYLLAFLPMFSVGDSVSSMTQKLFSGTGLWAAIVLLSVVYQSCALGYFYWSRVLTGERQEGQEEGAAWARLLGWGLGLSLLLGLSGAYATAMRALGGLLGVTNIG